MSQVKTKAKISNRIKPCNCGCQGRDPWHARSFTRIITITSEAEEVEYSRDGCTWLVVARGTARFPWGVETVSLRAVRNDANGKQVNYGWKRDAAY